MEITKDIIIDTSNLINKSYITICYSGKLCNSKKIFINFGYNPNSFEYETAELNKDKKIDIKIKNAGYFYFSFYDENKNLDNNYYKDYQLYIKKSNLIFSDNSSMKELPFRYIKDIEQNNIIYKTFYTSKILKNTSRPQEIIIPKPFNFKNSTSENISGLTIEPVKNNSLTQDLNLVLIPETNENQKRNFNFIIKKLFIAFPKLFNKDYS